MAMKMRLKSFVDNHQSLWKLKRYLYGHLYDYRDRKRGVPNWVIAPQDVQIDTHNYCSSTHSPMMNEVTGQEELVHTDEGCVFCNVKEGGAFKIPRGRMDDDLLFYILNYWGERKHLGVENMCPYVNGDPILDNRMPEICDVTEKNGQSVVVDTSGNVYKNRDYMIHPALTYLRFSISAITPETYAKTQGCDKFDEVIKTIDYVLENKYPTQTVEMHYMVNKYNEDEIESYIHYFNKLKGLKVKIFPLHEMEGIQLNSTANLPSETWRNVGDTQEAWEASRPIFIYPNGHRERQVMRANRTCQGMAYAVQHDGLILHCTDAPPDYEDSQFYLGHVKADGSGADMLEAWHKRNRQRINHPACRACNARRTDWEEILYKYDLTSPSDLVDYYRWVEERDQ